MNKFFIDHKVIDVNGLKVIIIPKPGFNSSYAFYATDFGSVNNHFSFEGKEYVLPEGVAHFLEHKMFEKPYGDIFGKFAEYGSDANAFTSFDMTGYLFSTTNNFEKSLDALCELVNEPYFTSETVKKEQGIIGQEIQMGLDNPSNKCFYSLMENLFFCHPVKIDIAGSVKSISEITSDLLYKCHDAFYRPSNMVLAISGNVDEDKVCKTVSERLRITSSEVPKRISYNEPENIVREKSVNYAEVANPIFNIGIKDNFKGDSIAITKHKYIVNLLLDMLFGKSSAFYDKYYANGLIGNRYSTETLYVDNVGAIIISGECDSPDKVFDAIKEKIQNITESDIRNELFVSLKNKTYGIQLETLDSTEDLAISYAGAFFDGYSYEESFDMLMSVSLSDIKDALKIFDISKLSLSAIFPTDRR